MITFLEVSIFYKALKEWLITNRSIENFGSYLMDKNPVGELAGVVEVNQELNVWNVN